MSLTTEVANLTTSVNAIKSAVETAKPVLDDRVDLGVGHQDTAKGHELDAKASRDEVRDYKEIAYKSLRDIKSIENQSLETIDNKTLTNNTANDVFIYDTSKDSDGGAWRHRTSHTSWYNEQLGTSVRGLRKEFPSVAVIVLEQGVLTIHDADDPDMPMWMVANVRQQDTSVYAITALSGSTGQNLQRVKARDGQLFIAGFGGYTSQALLRWDFVADKYGNQANSNAWSGWTTGNLASRNETSPIIYGSLPQICHASLHDVAVTVLDDAPIDPERGLPTPTIAVGTENGCSVIKDDGEVYDLRGSNWGSTCKTVEFIGDGILLYSQRELYLLSVDVKGLFADSTTQTDGRGQYKVGIDEYPFKQVSGNNYIGFRLNKGLAVSNNDDFDVAYFMSHYAPYERLTIQTLGDQHRAYAGDSSMTAYVTCRQNTGWMHGDTRLAICGDTTEETLSATENLLTNPNFDNDISSWGGSDFRWDSSGKLERYQGDTNSPATQYFNITEGTTYLVEYDVVHTGGWDQSNVFIDTGAGFKTVGQKYGSGHVKDYFTAQATINMQFRIYGINDFRGTFDNFVVRAVEGNRIANDTTVANDGLDVHGTVVKSNVASNADLVQYNLFNASAKLTKDNFDFPEYDGSVMFWTKDSGSDLNVLFLGDSSISPNPVNGINIWVYDGQPKCFWGGQSFNGPDVLLSNVWQFCCLTRQEGELWWYVDGELVQHHVGGNTNPVTETDLTIGSGYYSTGRGVSALALLRISATVPTPEQVKKIYEDEKALFQEGVKCTLTGTHNAIQALDYDDDQHVLHVGTDSGRSVFSGLQRVDSNSQPVRRAISASNGLVVEE